MPKKTQRTTWQVGPKSLKWRFYHQQKSSAPSAVKLVFVILFHFCKDDISLLKKRIITYIWGFGIADINEL